MEGRTPHEAHLQGPKEAVHYWVDLFDELVVGRIVGFLVFSCSSKGHAAEVESP